MPPRNEPRMLVGVFTVETMVPKSPAVAGVPLNEEISFTGRSKFAWLNRLKNCKPKPRLALSVSLNDFITVKSVLK